MTRSRIQDWHHVVVEANTQNRYILDVKDWCESKFGPKWDIHNRDGNWTCKWTGRIMHKSYMFSFRHRNDATLFSLGWS